MLWNAQPRIPLGTHRTWLLRTQHTLSLNEIRSHGHVIGKPGSGKSRALASLFLNLLRADADTSVTLVDPHGDLSHLVLSHLVAKRVYDDDASYERILYLDIAGAARQRRYLPFNIFKQPFPLQTRVENVLEAITRAWTNLADGNAPLLSNIVLNGCHVLAANNLTFPLLSELLVNKVWRDQLLQQVDDPLVVNFFLQRYDAWARERVNKTDSTESRIFLLCYPPVLRYSLAQRDNLLDCPEILSKGKHVIINLDRNVLSERVQKLLGCLISLKYEKEAGAGDETLPEERSGSHHLILDEFPKFASQSSEALSDILSQCRKYGLYLVLAHQDFDQIAGRLDGAIRNVGFRMAFTLDRHDAEYAARIFGKPNLDQIKHEVRDATAQERTHPTFRSLGEQWEAWAQRFTDLQPRQAYLRNRWGDVTQIRTLDMPDARVDPGRLREVKAEYLRRYFNPEAQVRREFESMMPQTNKSLRHRVGDLKSDHSLIWQRRH